MAATANTFLPTLREAPQHFLQPSVLLYTDAVAHLKRVLDPLAKDVAAEQHRRLQASRNKRKRAAAAAADDEDILRLPHIHTDGFGVDQVWQQARRVIHAASEDAERAYVLLKPHGVAAEARPSAKRVQFAGGGEQEEDEEEDEEDRGVAGGVGDEGRGVDDGEDAECHTSEDEDGGSDGRDPDSIGGMRDDFDDDVEEDGGGHGGGDEPAELVQDKFGLNDGFFSIDDFNRQSEFLEQRDARGEGDGAASDEEDIDWDADIGAQAAAGAAGDAGHGMAEDGEEDHLPTFGDPDAPSEDEDERDDVEVGALGGLGDMGNTNEIMYQDFFAPPAQKKRKNKNGRPHPLNFPQASQTGASQDPDDDADVERAMEKVKFDLFEDESEAEEDEEDEPLDPAHPRSRRSAHERRKAQIAEEIRKLEAANVAKRDWQLSGEARAADRPVNALLEEDLDFERTGKPVPVITAEVSESIEELIKRRILAHDFQDIIRRRPDDLATGSVRRGKLDLGLDDTKSRKGLAEEYEEAYSKRTDPHHVDVKDEKVEQEHKEIERLWKEVSAQLDSLSSWHFRPKPAAPQIDIRVDAPAITMEDARPTAGGAVAGASQLAPQEVYTAGEAVSGREEVAGTSGLPSARDELSREERKRRRRREKERIRKSRGNPDARPAPSRAAAAQKTDMLATLTRGAVKVIGAKGALTDVHGREARPGLVGGGGQGAARFKL